jgi:hypothetical protein
MAALTIAALLTEYGITPAENYAGEVTGDDYILAVDCSEAGASTTVADYAPVAPHIETVGAELSPDTEDNQYLYEGKSTMKTSTQRSFKVAGKRLFGDPFQDFVCSHAIKFGKGSKVERDYIYFCALTGVGEKGKVAICVNNDGGADSGAPGEIDVELVCTKAPTAYTYSAT